MSLLINQSVISKLEAISGKADGAKEVGGLLIGYRRGMHLHVIAATRPFWGDVGSKYRFVRKSWWHRIVALLLWVFTARRAYRLGEWHSHPEGEPNPSFMDRESWQAQVRDVGAPLVFVIVGEVCNYVTVLSPDNVKAVEWTVEETSLSGVVYKSSHTKASH